MKKTKPVKEIQDEYESVLPVEVIENLLDIDFEVVDSSLDNRRLEDK